MSGERSRHGATPERRQAAGLAAQERQRDEREDDHREQAGGDERDVVLGPDQAQVDADLAGHDRDAQRRRLQEPAGDELAAALGERPVEQRGQRRGRSAARRGRAARAPAVEPPWKRLATSSLIPVETKKNGMKTPKPTASSFAWKNACVMPSVAVDELERRAREERAEDRLEPELRREHDEQREQQERAADADLGGRVLQPHERLRDPHRALEAEDRDADRGDEGEERDQQHELRRRAPRTRRRRTARAARSARPRRSRRRRRRPGRTASTSRPRP